MENDLTKGWRTRANHDLECWEIINEYDEQVARLSAFDSMENARKRAELFRKAPELVDSLCDLLAAASREMPEHMRDMLKDIKELVSTIRR